MRRPWIEAPSSNPAVAIASSTRWLIALGGLGIAMVVPAIYTARRYPLKPHADALTDLGLLSGYTHSSFWLFVAALLIWFIAYAAGMVIVRRCEQQMALVIVLTTAAIAGLFLVMMYPVNATDMHMYAARSRLFTTYGADPIAVAPNAYPADLWRSLVSDEWAGRTSPYGPLWTLIAAPVTRLAGDDLLRALLGFKLLAFNCYLATGWLVARALAGRPGMPPAAAALVFLWNPLVLWEAVGNGHNDAVVALLLVAALAAWLRGRLIWVIPALVAATLLKYVAAILLPLALVAIVVRSRERGSLRRVLLQTTAISAVIVVAGLAPFYDLAAIRASATSQGQIYATSLVSVAVHRLEGRFDVMSTLHVLQAVGLAIVSVVMLVWMRRLVARPDRLPLASFEVMFVFLLVATTNFRGWYLIWLVALAAIAGSSWAATRAAAWSAGALGAYALFIWVWGWQEYTFVRVEQIGVALMFAPPIAMTLLQVAVGYRRQGGVTALAPAEPTS